VELGCNILKESLRLAVRRAGIRECLVEDALYFVGCLVVAYIKAILVYWEATEDHDLDEDDEETAEDTTQSDDESVESDEEDDMGEELIEGKEGDGTGASSLHCRIVKH
jgi:nucleosome binding factor SPN SPT16 subunit